MLTAIWTPWSEGTSEPYKSTASPNLAVKIVGTGNTAEVATGDKDMLSGSTPLEGTFLAFFFFLVTTTAQESRIRLNSLP